MEMEMFTFEISSLKLRGHVAISEWSRACRWLQNGLQNQFVPNQVHDLDLAIRVVPVPVVRLLQPQPDMPTNALRLVHITVDAIPKYCQAEDLGKLAPNIIHGYAMPKYCQADVLGSHPTGTVMNLSVATCSSHTDKPTQLGDQFASLTT